VYANINWHQLEKLATPKSATGSLEEITLVQQNALRFFTPVERKLEGLVAKRRMSVYTEHGWLKIKNPKYTQAVGRHDMFTAFKKRGARSATRRQQ
jgi:ATP-dependent DNA ligase